MSFNTRSGRGGGQIRNVGNIGQRRPNTNFVPGGQLTPQRGGIQQGYNTQSAPQLNRPQQQQGNVQQKFQQPQQNVQQQQKLQQQQQNIQQQKIQQQHQPQQQQQSIQQQQQQNIPQQPTLEQKQTQPIPAAAPPKSENGSEMGDKKKWMIRKAPKRERVKRRNIRLGKLLQPKNALMVLNELVMNTTFEVTDFMSNEGVSYRAVVVVDGKEHVGFGKSKHNAKVNAAEVALKHLVKTKKMSKLLSPDGAEAMDTSDGDNAEESSLPWQQVASFALYKLFDSWGETMAALKDTSVKELKPARKLPEHAETLNPLMVVNQMFPKAQFEELPKTGTAPNFLFNMNCTVEGQTFSGSGPTKKLAKRNVAHTICTNILGIKYNSDYSSAPTQLVEAMQ